jgi:hypothetical protein
MLDYRKSPALQKLFMECSRKEAVSIPTIKWAFSPLSVAILFLGQRSRNDAEKNKR